MKIELNAKFIIIAILVLIGLFWFFGRGCGNSTPAITQAKYDSALSAIAVKDAKMAVLQAENKRLHEDSVKAAINQEALAEESNKSYAIAGNAQDATKTYQHKYEDARKQVNDLLALSTCDSLTRAITNEREKSNKAIKACKDELNGCGDISVNLRKTIGNLNQQIKALQQPVNLVNDALHAAKAAVKEPWVKGYVGASVMGNQQSFGFGPDVTFVFKGGVMVKGGAVLMGSQVMGVVGISKLISFKKK